MQESPLHNPYTPPKPDAFDPNSAEAILRREHLSVENRLQTLGLLLLLSGGLLLMGNLPKMMLLAALTVTGQLSLLPQNNTILPMVFGVLYGGSSLWAGWHLRQLQARGRIMGAFLCIPWLFFVPIGTGLSISFLHALFSQKGKRVFEEDYSGIIARTPLIVVKTSAATWAALAVIIALTAAGIFFALS